MRKIACAINSWRACVITLALQHDNYICIGNLSLDFSKNFSEIYRVYKFYVIFICSLLLLFIGYSFPRKIFINQTQRLLSPPAIFNFLRQINLIREITLHGYSTCNLMNIRRIHSIFQRTYNTFRVYYSLESNFTVMIRAYAN